MNKEQLELYNDFVSSYQKAEEILIKEKRTDTVLYTQCIEKSSILINFFNTLNPMVIAKNKDMIKNTYFINSSLLIRTVGITVPRTSLPIELKNTLHIAITHLKVVLNIEPYFRQAMELYKISYIYLTLHNPDVNENIALLRQVLTVDPCDYQLQYNLGFMYQRANLLDDALSHYKLSIGIIDIILNGCPDREKEKEKCAALLDFRVKSLNGIGSIYYTVQDRELALYFFNEALKISPDDPDLNNQLGVLYTELRVTDLAIKHYMKGIEHYKDAKISVDKDMLVASMYMNMGLAKCYECDYTEAIECYNQALRYKPRLHLAYQNKLLDLNYISHMIEDPMYIAKLHKNINKIFEKVYDNYKITLPDYKPKRDVIKMKSKESLTTKLNIGFVSGDFICHPVAFFIHSILKYINYDIFEVNCFSVKVTKLEDMFPKCKWHCVKNLSSEDFASLIKNEKVDILFDLSAHTGDNRLDTFILKPAPIQISYCGYPGSSGIKSMDYHITDSIADSKASEKYYTEKLIYMPHCFLAYTPSTGIDNLVPIVDTQPCIENGYITFGSFNRMNKINGYLISVWEKILKAIPTARFVVKNKEFLTPKILQFFKDSIKDKSVLERITFLPYADTYNEHLGDYNLMDISLDSFPYSGTTTSCESLMMGVPILTVFDNKRYYHAQNVTSSLLINSDLKEYVTYSEEEYVNKAIEYSKNIEQLHKLKQTVRNNFVNGHVCNYPEFINNFENKLLNTYINHGWK